ncbi:hypothetical protein [Nesterenkonia suensis]
MKSTNPYERMEWAYSIPDLSPTQKSVLLNLAFRANSTTRRTWPSLGKIADDVFKAAEVLGVETAELAEVIAHAEEVAA